MGTKVMGRAGSGTIVAVLRSFSGPSQYDVMLCFVGWWMSLGARKKKAFNLGTYLALQNREAAP